MRRHGAPEVMLYEEVPQPSPSAPEALIKSEAIGVNYVDTMRRSGEQDNRQTGARAVVGRASTFDARRAWQPPSVSMSNLVFGVRRWPV
jgi:hypothetical protein